MFDSQITTEMDWASMIASSHSLPDEVDPNRDHLVIIRFPSEESRRQAYGALIESGKRLSYSTSKINVWNARTDLVRALLAAKVPFEWVTRDVR
jgi:hypothetical protein